MAMIFPGMDPYLENPQMWPGVHNALIVYLRDQLQPLLRPRYVASIEERVFIEGSDRQMIPDVLLKSVRPRRAPDDNGSSAAVAVLDAPVDLRLPDLEIHESYIAIVDRNSGRDIVTVEVVSPTNKYPGPGRDSYVTKQRELRGSTTHLVEIDLLRLGQHVLAVWEWAARGRGHYDYLVCVNRAETPRDRFQFYPRTVRERLPRFAVPLAGDDPPVPLDLQAAVQQVFEAGSYRDLIHYQQPCQPPLNADDQAWANELIARAS